MNYEHHASWARDVAAGLAKEAVRTLRYLERCRQALNSDAASLRDLRPGGIRRRIARRARASFRAVRAQERALSAQSARALGYVTLAARKDAGEAYYNGAARDL